MKETTRKGITRSIKNNCHVKLRILFTTAAILLVVTATSSSDWSIIVEAFSSSRIRLVGRQEHDTNNRKQPSIIGVDDATLMMRIISPMSLHLSHPNKNSDRNQDYTDDNDEVVLGDEDSNSNDQNSRISSVFEKIFSFSALMLFWLPAFASWGIPGLVEYARSFPPNSSQQFQVITILIVSTRIYLYSLALTIIGLVATRGSRYDKSSLGQRLTSLTEELLILDLPLRLDKKDDDENDNENKIQETISSSSSLESPSFIQKMVNDSGLEENLDNVNTETQALVLPLLVSGLLAASVLSLPLFGKPLDTSTTNNELFIQLKESMSQVIPILTMGWNLILLTLFTRAELRRLLFELFGMQLQRVDDVKLDLGKPSNNVQQIVLEIVIAITITGYGAYYLQYWPACNFVNMAIAILVARAIQLNTIQSIIGAFMLLTVYDGASVFLIPAANAFIDSNSVVDATSSFSSSQDTLMMADASASAMGSVAIQKLTSTTFQPGLLVSKLDGTKITGTLGLGDAVFPSILVTFLKRYDDDMNNAKGTSLFAISLVGYILGCGCCEIAPSISTRGVPALVFILPSMIICTIGGAIASDQFGNLWSYNSSVGSNSKN